MSKVYLSLRIIHSITIFSFYEIAKLFIHVIVSLNKLFNFIKTIITMDISSKQDILL